MDGAGTCRLGPHTQCGMELRVGREGVGIGVSLVSFIKMMRCMKLLGGFSAGAMACVGQCLAGDMLLICWLRLPGKAYKYQVTHEGTQSWVAAEWLEHLHQRPPAAHSAQCEFWAGTTAGRRGFCNSAEFDLGISRTIILGGASLC